MSNGLNPVGYDREVGAYYKVQLVYGVLMKSDGSRDIYLIYSEI